VRELWAGKLGQVLAALGKLPLHGLDELNGGFVLGGNLGTAGLLEAEVRQDGYVVDAEAPDGEAEECDEELQEGEAP